VSLMPVRLVLALSALLGVAAPTFAAAPAQPDARLLAAVRQCEAPSRSLLERAVAIDSGTGDADGLAAVGALFAADLEALGATVRRVPSTPPAVGDNLLATLTGTGKGRVLLIAHLDTVFSRGDVANRPPRWEGTRYIGPGAGDDKGGAVTIVCALSALRAIGFRDYARIDVILNVSEEVGSPGSRDLIQERARDSDLAINVERGVPGDAVLHARKGSAKLVLEFRGRAAHSGLEPEKGRNAALEAARVASELGKLANAAAQTSVTVVMLHSGEKTNVVPDRAQITADVRAFAPAEFDRVEREAAALAARPAIEGVTITSSLQRTFPPWPRASSTDGLVARAARLYAELGRTLTATEVGSSADVAIAAETGTPSIDGFGMEGGGAHGVDDYVDFATLTPRAYLMARMLMDAGRDPPKR
jgi:glutamate carboxypeptidase